uniref:Retrotransposon protein, putative, Ty3-gypsy subclass n=1 Tax=Tanacetum cinerariifolium TaxID=118510 RepID=A0A6L2JUC4_TANCI|nr:retrotransposon protein, putative, Ty3-gypsy subclass [Tanacetum cinerariifolium]
MKLIIQSKSPHMSPAFLVENEAEKRRGKKRMVVNYKKVNEATIGDSHNLPNMQELLTLLRGKNIFSSFDCKYRFWKVLLGEQSQLLTAFTCPNGHFQWKVVPFGLKQAPSIFQRHMQNALRGLENFCTVYVDDIIVFSESEEKHYIHVLEVLKTISKHELKSIDEQLNVLNASTVIDEPEGFPSLKSTTSPVQTTTGKDSINPLKADVWLKNMLRVNTGLTSGENSKLVNFSPPTLGKESDAETSTSTIKAGCRREETQECILRTDWLLIHQQSKNYPARRKVKRFGKWRPIFLVMMTFGNNKPENAEEPLLSTI